MVAVNSEVDRFVVVVNPRAVRQTKHQTSVFTHAVCGNTANLIVHLRDGSSAVCALVPARAAGSALQVAQLVGRRHAPQVGPLDVLEVSRRSLTLSGQEGHHRFPTATHRSERQQERQNGQKRPSSLQPRTRPDAFASAAPAFQQRRRLIRAPRPGREEPHDDRVILSSSVPLPRLHTSRASSDASTPRILPSLSPSLGVDVSPPTSHASSRRRRAPVSRPRATYRNLSSSSSSPRTRSPPRARESRARPSSRELKRYFRSPARRRAGERRRRAPRAMARVHRSNLLTHY